MALAMFFSQNSSLSGRSRAQVSLEYLGITAFFLAMAAIFFAYSFSTFSYSKNLSLGQDAVSRIGSNADLAASMGEGSWVSFDVEFPDTAQSLTIYNSYILMRNIPGSGSPNVYFYSKARLSPALIAVSQGRATMSASFSDGNVVIG